MSKKNPYKIKNNLSKFKEKLLVVFQPKGKKGKRKTKRIQIPGAYDARIPKQKFKYKTLKPSKPVRKAYLSQNKDLKRLGGRFKEKAVKSRIRAATKMPEFNLERVELVKPQFGLSKLPKKFFKK